MEPMQAISKEVAFKLFQELDVVTQTEIMMARSRVAKILKMPSSWPLAAKVGIADLSSGKE